ncbi:MAG: kynureninase [Candidatus Puniceispirillaceae bacterium]
MRVDNLTMDELTYEMIQSWDATCPFAAYRDYFDLPEGVIYLDGNSLGPLPKSVPTQIEKTMHQEWGQGLIRSWNAAGWIDLPQKIATKIATLIGADPDHVVVADSTSVNLFKTLSAALLLRPDRAKIITEERNFPTDNYIAEGVINQMGKGHVISYATSPDAIADMIDEDVAVVMLTHVNYRDGRCHDMQALTKAAHDKGALVLWDLAHSAGAMPVDLMACDADFAVGCGYKYLNGGPGAPAFLYVAPKHIGKTHQPLTGWFAHHSPFDFAPHYEADTGIKQYLCGTPPVLSAIALDAALDLWRDVDMQALRQKSLALTGLFIRLVDGLCAGHDLTLITPREGAARGSQVSYTHPKHGYAIMAALIAENVIGDFRAPDILRFGFTPLYTSYEDVWQAAHKLADILETRRWDQPHFHKRKAVT